MFIQSMPMPKNFRLVRSISMTVPNTEEINSSLASIASSILTYFKNYSVTIDEYSNGARVIKLDSRGIRRFLPRRRRRTATRIMCMLSAVHSFESHRVWSLTVR